MSDNSLPSQVDYIFSPTWITPEHAAFLMGRGYDLAAIHELMAMGAFDLHDTPDGGYLIERDSLREYQETLFDLLSE